MMRPITYQDLAPALSPTGRVYTLAVAAFRASVEAAEAAVEVCVGQTPGTLGGAAYLALVDGDALVMRAADRLTPGDHQHPAVVESEHIYTLDSRRMGVVVEMMVDSQPAPVPSVWADHGTNPYGELGEP
jgi:hypothetical protein